MEKIVTAKELEEIERNIKLIKAAKEITAIYDTADAVEILKQAIKINIDTIVSLDTSGYFQTDIFKEISTSKKINLTRLYNALEALEFQSMPGTSVYEKTTHDKLFECDNDCDDGV